MSNNLNVIPGVRLHHSDLLRQPAPALKWLHYLHVRSPYRVWMCNRPAVGDTVDLKYERLVYSEYVTRHPVTAMAKTLFLDDGMVRQMHYWVPVAVQPHAGVCITTHLPDDVFEAICRQNNLPYT